MSSAFIAMPLPAELDEVKDLEVLSSTIAGDFGALKSALLG